ncbi:MAG: hypothetical protein PHF51_03880 [Candidatus ainarchaeum sp.]|nr:hypothetical protein [Candidatus ainarchaeum sp.]
MTRGEGEKGNHARKAEGNDAGNTGAGDVIAEITGSEEVAARDIAKAREKKDARLMKAQENAREIKEKASRDADALGAKMVTEARAGFSSEAEAALSAAKKEEESARRKKADARLLDAAFNRLLEEVNA